MSESYLIWRSKQEFLQVKAFIRINTLLGDCNHLLYLLNIFILLFSDLKKNAGQTANSAELDYTEVSDTSNLCSQSTESLQ